MISILKTASIFALFLLCLGAPATVTAQADQSTGVITFHKVYPGIPGYLEETLAFSGGQSLQTVKRDKQVYELDNGYRITHPAKDERMFHDQTKGRIVRQQYDTKKKDYVLWTYAAPAYQWELHDEYRTIGEYQCQKATVLYHEPGWGVATAWFTTQIPLSVGPERTYGLPGLIVELSFENNWDARYILKEIRYEAVGKLEPTEGTVISGSNEGNKSERRKALQGVLGGDGN